MARFQPYPMHWNYRDIFRAPRFGLGVKKIFTMWVALWVVWLLHTVGSYLVWVLNGEPASMLWAMDRLLPRVAYGDLSTWPARLVFLLFVVLSFWVLYLAFTAHARLVVEQLRGNEFLRVSEAYRFAYTRGHAVFSTFVFLGVVMFLLIALLWIYALLGAVPYLGDLILVLGLPVALFLGLFFVYLALAFVLQFLIGPVVAAVIHSDAFDGVFELLTTLNLQIWRYATYQVISLAMSLLSGTVALAVFWSLLGLLKAVVVLVPAAAAKISWYATFARALFFGAAFPLEPAPMVPWAAGVLGWVAALIEWGVILVLPSLILSVFWAGQTLLFLVIARKKDDLDYLAVDEEDDLLLLRSGAEPVKGGAKDAGTTPETD